MWWVPQGNIYICKVGLSGLNYPPVNQKFARVIHSNAASAKKEKIQLKSKLKRLHCLQLFYLWLLLFVAPSGWLLYDLQAVRFVILFDRFERSFGRSSDRPAGWLLFGVWYVVQYDVWYVVWYVVRYVVWYDPLLGVLLNMLLYALLGRLLDSTLLWDALLMRCLICCWLFGSSCFRWNRVSLFSSSRFSMKSWGRRYFSYTQVFLKKIYKWRIGWWLVKKLKSSTFVLLMSEYSFLTSFFFLLPSRELTYCSNIFSPHILTSPQNRIGNAWYERHGGTFVVQDIWWKWSYDLAFNINYSRVTFIGDGVRQYVAAARE